MNEKMINIIYRDVKGTCLLTHTVKYNKKEFKNLSDVVEYFTKKFKIKNTLSGYYDYFTRRNILAQNGLKNGFINWKVDFYEYDLDKAFSISDNITIIIYNAKYGMNAKNILDTFSYLENICSLLKFIFINHRIHKNPFREFCRYYYNLDEKFIKDVIMCSSEWKVGFISKDNFYMKKKIEKMMMKKLNYKVVNNRWVHRYNCNFYDYNDLYY